MNPLVAKVAYTDGDKLGKTSLNLYNKFTEHNRVPFIPYPALYRAVFWGIEKR